MSRVRLNSRVAPHSLSDIAPVTCRRRLVETARLEWRRSAGGDPAGELVRFLGAAGVPADITLAGDSARRNGHAEGDVCGAAVFVSAAAAAAMIDARPGQPSPAPALPDLVAVVFTHAGTAAPDPRPATPWRPDRWRPDGARLGEWRPDGWRLGGWRLGGWRPSWSARQHAAAVRAVRSAIADGEAYQVNLVGHASAPYTGDPAAALDRVTRLRGARYAGMLAGDGWALACASPETLVEVRAGGPSGPVVVTRPIKGTRPATATGRAELLASAKERAEHVMIVDLARNDLARVAATGTVRVDELYGIRRWCELWQAESTVSAGLAPGTGLADLLRAVCPGGSVTGAPKLSALDLIAGLEPVGRGPSMGAFGWIGPDGVDLGLTIRTVAADADRVHVWAGGGITWGSDPDAEVAEAAAKAAPLYAALGGGR